MAVPHLATMEDIQDRPSDCGQNGAAKLGHGESSYTTGRAQQTFFGIRPSQSIRPWGRLPDADASDVKKRRHVSLGSKRSHAESRSGRSAAERIAITQVDGSCWRAERSEDQGTTLKPFICSINGHEAVTRCCLRIAE